MQRKTEEVEIRIEFDKEETDVSTGDNILDHMLETLFFYMDEKVKVEAEWDIRHHLWEDMGILLGDAINGKIKDKNIQRFGNAVMPMDDALVLISIDISRAYINLEINYDHGEKGFDLAVVSEFLNALSRNLPATIQVKQLSGVNGHHVIEAVFKALGVALSQAISQSEELKSTKGIL
ncbi:MAG: imidazoleglycerol-phosphate dehydratase HisB [Candidatus Thermoplasmatota archaeon]|nr:imidazoleglycerol-phosphate dehydratase HisB [Candidatus Thermoplasmatota archaeon]